MYDLSVLVSAFRAQPIVLAMLACAAVLGTLFVTVVACVHVIGLIRGEAYVKRMLSGSFAERREFRQRYDRENKNNKYKKYASRRRRFEK